MRDMLKRLWRNERGDLLVTPTVILLGIAATFVLGGLAYLGSRAVTPKVTESRQNLTIDDNGNVVEGAVGVIPVPTPKPTPTPEPKTVVIHERVYETAAPAYQPGGVIVVDPGNDGSTSAGHSSSSNSGSGDGSGCCGGDMHTHDPYSP